MRICLNNKETLVTDVPNKQIVLPFAHVVRNLDSYRQGEESHRTH